MIEMENKLPVDTDWSSGNKYMKSSLHAFFTATKNNHNVVSLKKQIYLEEDKRNFQALKNMKNPEDLTNKDSDKINDEEASISSDVITTNHKSQPLNSTLTRTVNENAHIRSEIKDVHETLCRRGQIDVIEMPLEQTYFYKYFLVYEDLPSKFVVLHALQSNTAKEVANKLLDILSIIGAPQVLQSGNGRNFAEQIVKELRILWKDFIILHGNICKCEEDDNRDFKNLLKCWLNKNPDKSWYEGLKFIQIFQNSTYRCQNGKIPCDVLFGQNVHQEFQKLIIPKNAANDMWTEEEWINDTLNKKLNNTTTIENSTHTSENIISINTSDTDKNDNCHIEYHDISHNNHVNAHDDSIQFQKNSNSFKFVSVKSETFLDNLQMEDSICMEANIEEHNFNINNQNLTCKICNKQYMKLGHLKNHMKTHIKKRQFDCTLCNKKFHILKLYEKHMQQFHENPQQINSDIDCIKKDKINSKYTEINLSKKGSIETEEIPKTHKSIMKSYLSSNIVLNRTDKCIRSIKKSNPINGRQFPRKREENRISRLNGNPTLECSYCKQKFSFPSVLKRHMRSHTNERPYICKICNKSFKQLGHLSQHSLTHKDYKSIQCTTCCIKFESLDLLKTHSQLHQGESILKSKEIYRLFECDNCKKVFTTKSVLERHIFTHTHERQFGCKICGKRFKQAGHVKSHMLVHTGERKFECTVCSKRFSLSNSLKKHMYIHNGEKPYQCDVCGARFLEKRNLNGHLMTHTNERPFSCKICGKRYTLADTLRRHVSAAHEDGRTYQCEICAKMFKQLAHLSVHKKVHNDERPFQCHLCEKNFKHKNVLKSHLAIHANIRPFECDICKATFVRKTNLQTHIASAHMNERPYACTICGKRFKQISHLNGHVVVHSNSMPYQCDYCDRRCNRLDNLKKHMRLHTKDKE
ncbi:PREDICTED: zinc finger protein 585A-like isoform X1 [Polistes dominula]|uniref:Zinc finger protein 585A-like isoform X1 n=2 Tax=Polistes dominula TaxID=743375 RepID=A0ABM1HW74_POLDO|nr:PREDICTED: zinc finger protein 585A-like isoform X1 [Polistes dominula]